MFSGTTFRAQEASYPHLVEPI